MVLYRLFVLILAAVFIRNIDAVNTTDDCQLTTIKTPEYLNTSFSYKGAESINFTCGWKVDIPENHFSILYINTNISNTSIVRISQSKPTNQNVEEFTSRHVEKAFFFIPPGFEIHFISKNSSDRIELFNIVWQKHNNNSVKTYNVSKNEAAVVLNHDDTYKPVVINGETKISILATPGVRPEEMDYLRATIVFDGPTMNSPFLGSLFTIANSPTQLVSSNSSITIFSLLPKMTEHHIIVQDYSNSRKYSKFKVVRIDQSKSRRIMMNSSKIDGKWAPDVVFTELGSLVESEYLKSVELEKGSELRVYIDGLAESQRIATYNTSNNRTHLPQKFHSAIRFYVLTSGSANITLTRNVDDAKWMQPFDGRQGFVSSSFYKSSKNRNNPQDSFYFIGFEGPKKNTTKFTFSYKIDDVDISGNCSLHVVITDYDERINYYDHRDSLSNDSSPVDTRITRRGQSISFLYSSNRCYCHGYYGEFKITNGDVAIFRVFILIVVVMIFNWELG